MIAVMGATGNTGKAVAERLLGAGKKIKAIGRSREKLRPFLERGAEAAAGDGMDPAFLASAFRGAEAVYAMVPADHAQPDLRKYYNRFGESIAEALRRSEVRRVVFLSSLGAELPEGTGPIVGLHDLEERFKKLSIDLLILRPGFFYENFYGSLGLIKQQGINGGAIAPDVPFVMTATQDIGAAAAEELLRDRIRGGTVREVLGPRDYSMAEATRILGTRIGKPDLKYVQFPDAEFVKALVGMGFSRGMAEAFVEMSHAINARKYRSLEGRHKGNTMPTTFEAFAERLAASYRAM